MQVEGTRPSLESVLTQEVQCSANLLACLEAERAALTRRDMDALQNTTREKLEHTRMLEQLEQQRETLVTGLGFNNDQDGLRRCFQSLPQTDTLAGLWSQILSNIEACRTGNLTNGGILESGRHHAEQALCILRGQSGAPAVYDPHGDTSTNLGQRELGKV